MSLGFNPLAPGFRRPHVLASASGLHEKACILPVLLGCLDQAKLSIIVDVVVNGLRDKIALRNAFGSRLLLRVQETLLVVIGLLGVVSDRITSDQFASFLVPSEYLSLRCFFWL